LEQLVKPKFKGVFPELIHHAIYVVNCAVEYMIYLLVGETSGSSHNASSVIVEDNST
jgi:hypothetical protein